jgi:multiple sugar transport system permease protein
MMDASERRALWLMATPFLVGVVALVAVPALGSVWLSFTEWDLIHAPDPVGLDNYRELLDDPVFRISLRNSLLFLVASVPLRLVGALGLALLLHRSGRLATAGRVAAVVPTAIPDAAYALVWLWLLNPLYGPVNLALGALGLPTPSWLTQPGPARWGIVLMGAFQLGEGFLIALVARRQVSTELLELATIDGAGRWRRFAHVILPSMAPALLLVAIRDTILTLHATFVPALLVTEGGPPPFATTFLPLFAFRNAFEYLRYGYASAAVVLMLLLTLSIAWLQYRLVARWVERVPA